MSTQRWIKTFCSDRYSISDGGAVRNDETRHLLKLRPDRKGYLLAWLQIDTKNVKVCRVSRLMLESFVGCSPSEDMHAAHIDGNKDNNSLSNLCWATPSENERHKIAHGTAPIGERHPMAKLNAHSVDKIRERLRAGDRQKDIAESFAVSSSTIRLISKGRTWKGVPDVKSI